MALGAEGNTGLAIKTLSEIPNKLSSGLQIAVALHVVHKMSKIPDIVSISQIEAQINEYKRSTSAASVVQAAQIYWIVGDTSSCNSLIQPLTTITPVNKEVAALIGWIKLSEADRNSGRWFDMANADSKINVDPYVLYGKAIYYSTVSRWQESNQLLSQIGQLSDFPESALERARIYIASNNWDLALESLIEGKDGYISDIDSLFIRLIYCLSQIGDLEAARGYVRAIIDSISKIEPNNVKFISLFCDIISSLSWGDDQILLLLFSLLASLKNNNEDHPYYLRVYGRILLILGKHEEAIEVFQTSLVFDSESSSSISGLISAYIGAGQIENAQDQMLFFESMIGDVEKSMTYHVLRLRISNALNEEYELDDLIKSMKSHVDYVHQINTPMSARLSPDQKLPSDRFSDQIVNTQLYEFKEALNEAINHCNTLDHTVSNPINGPICDLIARMVEFLPGIIPFSYYLAILAFGENRYSQAIKGIMNVLSSKWGYNQSNGYILLAQIRLQMKQFDEAEACLNRAVSYDFGIRSSTKYLFISSQLYEAKGQFNNAQNLIADALKNTKYTSPKDVVEMTKFLANIMLKTEQIDQARSIIEKLLASFADTEFYTEIMIFKANFLSEIGNINESFNILKSIPTQSPAFSKAIKYIAEIYLIKLRDKSSYIKCFRSLVHEKPTKKNFVLLAKAYKRVKMFSQATESYEKAFEIDDSDQKIALKLARSYSIIHEYQKALNTYNIATEISNHNNEIILEQCEFLYLMKMYQESYDIAIDEMQTLDIDISEWQPIYIFARFAELLSKIECALPNQDSNSNFMQESIIAYDKLCNSFKNDIPTDVMQTIKEKASELYMKLSESFIENKDFPSALNNLEKANDLYPDNVTSMLSLARLYTQMGMKDECISICKQIIKIDPSKEEASILMLEFGNEQDLEQLTDLYKQNPTFFRALNRIIELTSQKGDIDKSLELLKIGNSKLPGHIYCVALFNFITGNPQKAIELFHSIRNDSEWGELSRFQSFRIYTNPNRQFTWCEERSIATEKDLESAQKLMKRMNISSNENDLLEATVLLSRNSEESVKQALSIYNRHNQDEIPILIGRCRCFLRLGQIQEVTRNLNSFLHSQPQLDQIYHFVEANLMVSYINYQNNVFEESIKYAKIANEYDKSCIKAWEMLAVISEKNKLHNESAIMYEHAWKLSGKNNLKYGFKLAVNQLKSNNIVESIKTCRSVFEKHPNYPQMREQVFLPAIEQLRK